MKQSRCEHINLPDGGQRRFYTCETSWPEILVQTGVLRHAMAWMPVTQDDRDTMSKLEGVVWGAVQDELPSEYYRGIFSFRGFLGGTLCY